MPLKIRIDDYPDQEQQITLNGVTFFVRLYYNSAYLTDNWMIDILDQNKDAILIGKRVTATTNINANNLLLKELLDGYLFCVNTTGTRTPINRDNFGTEKDYQIWYYSNTEIEDGTNT